MRDRAEVARQPHKLEVVGSIPSPATKVSDRPLENCHKHRVGGVSKDPSLLSGAVEIGKHGKSYVRLSVRRIKEERGGCVVIAVQKGLLAHSTLSRHWRL